MLVDPGSSGNQGLNQSSTFAALVTSGNIVLKTLFSDHGGRAGL
jgi:hypothetical protein